MSANLRGKLNKDVQCQVCDKDKDVQCQGWKTNKDVQCQVCDKDVQCQVLSFSMTVDCYDSEHDGIRGRGM